MDLKDSKTNTKEPSNFRIKDCKQDTGIFEKVKTFYRTVTVEPVVVLFILPSFAAILATQNLTLEKACRVNLQINESICDGISKHNTSMYNETDEVQVQKLVASMYAWKNVAQSIVPAILLMLVGSWSDRHQRRKPCIIVPIFGGVMLSCLYIVCTYFFYELSAEYCLLAEAISIGLTGGGWVLFLGMYSYVSDVSSPETRTLRIGAITTLVNACATAGIGVSGFLYALIGYYGVFLLTLCMFILGILYGSFAIKENPIQSDIGFFRDFFDVSHLHDTFKIVSENQDPKRRKRIFIIMILVMVVSGPVFGEEAVMYLFVRYRFQWSEIDYSMFAFYASVLHIVATIFSLSFFSKYLGMDDALMGLMSSMSKILSSFIYCFATSPSMFYFGAVIEVFNGTSYIALRSIISKLVEPDELGKINSLFGVCEALMPLVYGPIYSTVYKYTIEILPGAFFLFGSGLTVPGVIIFLWLYREHKRDEILAKRNKEKDELETETSIRFLK